MTAETNKIVMGRFLEFINTASVSLAQELISPDAIFHVPGSPEPMRGPAGYLAIIGMMRGGFPDIQWTLEEMVAEGDNVAARFTMRGTHRGAFFGVPPTGKTIAVQAMNIYRLSGGQFVEEHGQPDMLGRCSKSARYQQLRELRAQSIDDIAKYQFELRRNATNGADVVESSTRLA